MYTRNQAGFFGLRLGLSFFLGFVIGVAINGLLLALGKESAEELEEVLCHIPLPSLPCSRNNVYWPAAEQPHPFHPEAGNTIAGMCASCLSSQECLKSNVDYVSSDPTAYGSS